MKQQQLTFDKGLSTAPSDNVCSDNSLEESVGLIFRDGEHHVIQKPSVYMSGLGTRQPLLVHKFNNIERYICIDGDNIVWGTRNATSGVYTPVTETVTDYDENDNEITVTQDVVLLAVSGTPKISVIGRTLIIADNNGMHYYLWQDGSYLSLGQRIPEPTMRFRMLWPGWDNNLTEPIDTKKNIEHNGSFIWIQDSSTYGWEPSNATTPDKEKEYDDFIIGTYSELKAKAKENNRFCNPFFVRYALELYDGTYTMVSNPILLLPSIHRNFILKYQATNKSSAHLYSCLLQCKYLFDYSNWSDIVKNVVVFASDEVEVNDFEQTHQAFSYTTQLPDGIYSLSSNLGTYRTHDDNQPAWTFLKARSDVASRLMKVSTFYKLAELGVTHLTYNWGTLSIQPHVVTNLTSQQLLPNDDYHSRDVLAPSSMKAYNSRLLLANAKRFPFDGFDFFAPYDGNNAYTFYVTITTDSGTIVVEHMRNCDCAQGLYFYYPDARAKHVVIKKGNNYILNADLTPHEGLNGAYYFAGLPTAALAETALSSAPNSAYVTPNNNAEYLRNYILQSEVNNPFIFLAEGYANIGSAEIIDFATTTTALSEGQFGQFPLLIFNTEGIWAASINEEGIIVSSKPMSREVCNNPASIVQTDNAVFFSSNKGLMRVVGSQVDCVSELLNGDGSPICGMSFADFLKSCCIAYDYRDSLLWIMNYSANTASAKKCYVYSMKSGTFSTFTFVYPSGSHNVYSTVNNYPDTLLYASGILFSLLNRPTPQNDTFNPATNADDGYDATFTTRPMKFENAMALKSIMDMKHVCRFKPVSVQNGPNRYSLQGMMAVYIYASNNLCDWVELTSLRGMPWKYYKFKYDFTLLRATDTFAGTIVLTQERRTNKLR